MAALFSNPFYSATFDDRPDGLRLVRLVRSSQVFSSLPEVDTASREVINCFAKLDLSRSVLLVDLRNATGRNDPEFERAMSSYRPKMLHGFRKVCIVVKTAVGALQMNRHLAREKGRFYVVNNESMAIEYLTTS